MTLTNVPPVDLRRDELPYLRMGKALGDLSVHPQGGDVEDSFERQSSLSKMTPALKERWEKIVSFVQKKYPLHSLKEGFLKTKWISVSDVSGMLFNVQVSIDEQSSCCDAKVFIQLDPECDIDDGRICSIRKKIVSDILSIDRDFCQKRQSEKQ